MVTNEVFVNSMFIQLGLWALLAVACIPGLIISWYIAIDVLKRDWKQTRERMAQQEYDHEFRLMWENEKGN